jgi:hypothetical protein
VVAAEAAAEEQAAVAAVKADPAVARVPNPRTAWQRRRAAVTEAAAMQNAIATASRSSYQPAVEAAASVSHQPTASTAQHPVAAVVAAWQHHNNI